MPLFELFITNNDVNTASGKLVANHIVRFQSTKCMFGLTVKPNMHEK